MKSLSNKFMHLTNYSINKKNEGAYQANSDETVCQGHKWYVEQFLISIRNSRAWWKKGVNQDLTLKS